MSAREILEEIRRMPEAERRELVARIEVEFSEFDDTLTPEQAAELERRAEEALKNPGRLWEEVRADMHKRMGWK